MDKGAVICCVALCVLGVVGLVSMASGSFDITIKLDGIRIVKQYAKNE